MNLDIEMLFIDFLFNSYLEVSVFNKILFIINKFSHKNQVSVLGKFISLLIIVPPHTIATTEIKVTVVDSKGAVNALYWLLNRHHSN